MAGVPVPEPWSWLAEGGAAEPGGLVDCPRCGAPAELTPWHPSSSLRAGSPLLRARCVCSHWFLVPLRRRPSRRGNTADPRPVPAHDTLGATPQPTDQSPGDRMGPLMPQPRRPILRSAGGAPGHGRQEFIACPQCDAPASVVPGQGLACTDGDGVRPVEHVRVWCADGHWFLMPRDMLRLLPD